MKKLFPSSLGLLVHGIVCGADPNSLAFGGERIGIPPLSLTETIAKSAVPPKPFQFGTSLPSYSALEDRLKLSPDLVPHARPNFAPPASRPTRQPRVSRASGMPILEPNDAVDYKLTIVPPDPSIDFKMIVQNPTPKSQPEPAK